jgi:glycosyltransferase involved in cell wall biosynthesis
MHFVGSSLRARLLRGIGIAPMRDDDWSRGKCALKVLQYMASGLPVVSSNVGVNAEVLAGKSAGFLASSPEDWGRFLSILAQEPRTREKMGVSGMKVVNTGYSNVVAFTKWHGVVTSALGL